MLSSVRHLELLGVVEDALKPSQDEQTTEAETPEVWRKGKRRGKGREKKAISQRHKVHSARSYTLCSHRRNSV